MIIRFPSLRARLAASLASCVLVAPLAAQTFTPTATPTYPAIADADPVTALSRYLRMLAANPRDLASLTGAGRAALAVGDANAALGFYARAEEIAPRNGRIKAGLAAALVQMEQPRTALKLFDEAIALGVPVIDVAADRGLAHDLNGEGRRAQADYTLALRGKEDDETLRRLALSMAISGDRAGALTMLDPLLRRGDGGAIRARAFVLALTGDQAGAATAVRGAMPGPQASVMSSFMTRLARLNPAQKALAVNFGYFPSDGRSYSAAELFVEQRRDPASIAPVSRETALAARNTARGSADAPLIPAGQPLGVRPSVVTATADPAAAAPRRRPGQIDPVGVAPPAHVLSAPIPGVTPPVTASVSPARGIAVTPAAIPAVLPATTAMAAAMTPPAARQAPDVVSSGGVVAAAPSSATGSAGQTGVAAAPFVPAANAVASAGGLIVSPRGPALAMVDAGAPSSRAVPVPIGTVDLSASTPPVSVRPPEPATSARAVVRLPVAPKAPVPVRITERPAAVAKTGVADRASRKAPEGDEGRPVRLAALADKEANRPGRTTKPADKATTAKNDKAAKAAAVDEKGAKTAKAGPVAAKGKAADKDATARDRTTRTAAAKEKPATAAAKSKADAKADARADTKAKAPERYWVQVASGSNKANLDRAWGQVKGKAPKLLDGKTTYTAPWRASNRLLIGPFKTEEEAQVQVNKLAKAGVSGIQFTSRAGADVEKVAGR